MKIAFVINFPEEYKGGINYYKNLFFALNKYYLDQLKIVAFIPSDYLESTVAIFSPYSTVVRTKVFQRFSFSWTLNTLMNRIFKNDYFINKLLLKYEISIVSYCATFHFLHENIKVINWIPDFQYIHFPSLWTKRQLKKEKNNLDLIIRNSNRIILSSHDALGDFNNSGFQDYEEKASVIHFVSQPSMPYVEGREKNLNSIPFFYLPNQFWEHKNHMVVFKAVNLLIKKGLQFELLCTGVMNDYRGRKNHLKEIQEFIINNKLEKYIKFLGVIDYTRVLDLFRDSIAVINPSLFEGWSSTVEESKVLGKQIILSDIPVHKEQNPKRAFYFDPHDHIQLAEIMESLMNKESNLETDGDMDQLKRDLEFRTKEFANSYFQVLLELEASNQ